METVYATEQQVSILAAYGVLASSASILTTEEAEAQIEQYRTRARVAAPLARRPLPDSMRLVPRQDTGLRNSLAFVNAHRALPYREYLLTDWWRKIKAAAIRRANHRCELCGARGKLDVHHKTYKRLGAELDEDLTALCRACHDKQHS